MADLIKKIKIKKQDGTFTDYIPIGAEAQNISTNDGDSVQLKLNKKPYYYNSVADMKADTKLKAGDMAVTLGYYKKNDGGGANYIIRNITNDDVVDNATIISLNNSNLIAELIYTDINIKQFGAKGDGITDDTNIFKNAILKLKENSNIIIPKSTYYLTDTLNFPENTNIITIKGNNSILNFNIKIPDSYAINLYATDNNYIKVKFENMRIVNLSDQNINCFHLRRNTELTLFDTVRVDGFYNNVVTSDNWNILIKELISINAKNSNFICESAAINNISFIDCQFKNSNNINFKLTGKAHSLIGCDLSIYKNDYNEFSGCDGLSINSIYYEDNPNCENGIIFNSCRGVNLIGGYFESFSQNDNYKLLNIDNVFGLNILGAEFRANNMSENSYSIYCQNGSRVNIECCNFRNISNCIYVHNSSVNIITNILENVTKYINQFNHNYAFIYGTIINTSDFSNSSIPKPEYCDIKCISQPFTGGTSERPNGFIRGQQYFNTTTQKLEIWNGTDWI